MATHGLASALSPSLQSRLTNSSADLELVRPGAEFERSARHVVQVPVVVLESYC